ncbi:efflux transporter outer membrane subunit, partial [Geomonas sp.]|uniref:efflux transporter outer membrane subunit n=1 Tax=Geomonas sp. TaxID=2651584 RepID=UPI002B48A7F3
MRIGSVFSVVTVLAALVGCTAGPDFHRPEAPGAKALTAVTPPAQVISSPGPGGGEQRLVQGGKIPEQWWRLFQCEALDRLIRQALKESPTLEAASARVRQAQETYRSRGSAIRYPKIDGNLSVNRQQISGAAIGERKSFVLTLFDGTLNASYTLDLAGSGRRELEGLAAQIDYQRFQLEGAQLTLAANIVAAALNEASLRARIAETRTLIDLQKRQLELVDEQLQVGATSLPDLLAQKSQLAQLVATLSPLEKELELSRHLLAVLAGRFPGDADLPTFSLDDLKLPGELPVSLPSDLVRQRPDIRASEELLHAASADVGVATANLYPQITLSGNVGSEAIKLGDFFANGTGIWSIGAGLVQPIFHGDELTAKRRAAQSAYEAALAQYKETVLQGFQNVADALHAIDRDAATLQALTAAEAAARDSLEASREQFQVGMVSYLTLLNAQRQYQDARLALAPARAARLSDSAQLLQALGGGWWNREKENGTDTS